MVAKLVVGELLAPASDDAKTAGQPALHRQVEERGQELPPGQIPGGAENNDDVICGNLEDHVSTRRLMV
jgi:hypothetical protein